MNEKFKASHFWLSSAFWLLNFRQFYQDPIMPLITAVPMSIWHHYCGFLKEIINSKS